MYKFLMGFMLLGLAFVFTGCSTVGGVGEDIQSVGEIITDESEAVAEDLNL